MDRQQTGNLPITSVRFIMRNLVTAKASHSGRGIARAPSASDAFTAVTRPSYRVPSGIRQPDGVAQVNAQRRQGTIDARSLPVDELERLRRQAVAAVGSGVPQTEVARLFGVSRKAVGGWVRAYRSGGETALRPQARGRRVGERLALSPPQQTRILAVIATGAPDDLGLPYLLWTRRAIADLIRREFGLALAGSTIDHYLLRWDLIGREGVFAQWCDCPPGALLVSWTRPRSAPGSERGHALVARSERGLLHFLAGERPFTAAALLEFRRRLRMQLSREVELLVCEWPDAHAALADCLSN